MGEEDAAPVAAAVHPPSTAAPVVSGKLPDIHSVFLISRFFFFLASLSITISALVISSDLSSVSVYSVQVLHRFSSFFPWEGIITFAMNCTLFYILADQSPSVVLSSFTDSCNILTTVLTMLLASMKSLHFLHSEFWFCCTSAAPLSTPNSRE